MDQSSDYQLRADISRAPTELLSCYYQTFSLKLGNMSIVVTLEGWRRKISVLDLGRIQVDGDLN